jgi:hypothetical protein
MRLVARGNPRCVQLIQIFYIGTVYAQEERLPVFRRSTMEKQKQSPRDMPKKGGQQGQSGQQAKSGQTMPPGTPMAPPAKGGQPARSGNK